MSKVKVADDTVNLRRGVDHIGITVNFLIHDGKGKILLHKRSKNCRDEQGRWDVGGGAVEFGETLEEALHRELFEEFGVKPLEFEKTRVGTALREHEGQPTHWVYINYKVLVDPKKIINGEPHKIDEMGWLPKIHFRNLFIVCSQLRLKLLKNIICSTRNKGDSYAIVEQSKI